METRIELKGMKFYAYHGFYEQERDKGGWYIVDVSFNCPADAAIANDDITGTVNYEEVFSIVKEEMTIPSKLIEHLAGRILKRIKEEVKHVANAEVKLSKLEPPLDGNVESVNVNLTYKE